MNLLDRTDLELFVRGAVAIQRSDRAVTLERMPPHLIDRIRDNQPWYIRARCNSGQVLAFRTDAPWWEIELKPAGGARPYLGLDADIDGIPCFGLRDEQPSASVVARIEKPACLPASDMCEFRLHLPPNMRCRLIRCTLPDQASIEPVPPSANRLLCLGDSITQGMEARSPRCAYPVQLARMLDMDLLNLGIGGHVFDPDFRLGATPFRPSLVTVAYGTNDWSRGTPRDAVQETCRAFFAALRADLGPTPEVVVITPIWRADAWQANPGGTLAEFAEAIAEGARAGDQRVHIVDGFRLVPHQAWYYADPVHPNDLGFLAYASNLLRILKQSDVVNPSPPSSDST